MDQISISIINKIDQRL